MNTKLVLAVSNLGGNEWKTSNQENSIKLFFPLDWKNMTTIIFYHREKRDFNQGIFAFLFFPFFPVF